MSEKKINDIIEKKYYQLTGADLNVVAREDRINQTPVTNVDWVTFYGADGKRGVCRCVPRDEEMKKILSSYDTSYVQYSRTGEPNFKPFTEAQIRISTMQTNRNKNFSAADKELLKTSFAKKNGLKTQADVEQYRKENNLTWHECSDGVTMQLMNSEINLRFGHSGGISVMKAIENPPENEPILRAVGRTVGTTRVKVNKKIVEISSNVKDMNSNIDVELIQHSVEQAGDAALVTAATSTVHNIFMVAYGEKNADEAAKDVLQATGSTFLMQGVKTYCKEKVWKEAKKLTTEECCWFLKNEVSKYAGQITLALKNSQVLCKYIDGQMDLEESVAQIGITVAGQFAFTAGSVILPPLGGVVAQMITEFVCNAIYSEVKIMKQINSNNSKKLHKMNAIANEALCEMELHRDLLRSEMERVYAEWDIHIEKGFSLIAQGTLDDDIEGVSCGYDAILELFSKKVCFASTNEFENFLLSGKVLIF